MHLRKPLLALIVIIFTTRLFSQTIEVPEISYVTVDRATQQVSINWTMNNPSIVDGYSIKRQIFGQTGVVEGSFNTIATINNRNQFSYLDAGADFGFANPGAKSENYRVAAFTNNAGTIEFSTMSIALSTIYLQPVELDICLEQNSLTWTSYDGFGTNLNAYRIYYSNTPTGTPILLDEVSGTNTTYIHTEIESNIQYYYYVEAFSNLFPYTSASNVQLITSNVPPIPQVMNADFVTVEFYDQLSLSFTVDANAVINAYVLLKSDSLNGTYDSIASFPQGSSNITYTDFVYTSGEIAYYKVIAVNSCGILSRESNIANNIVLEASPGSDVEYSNTLSWNSYENWKGNVDEYIVYRSIEGGPYEEIDRVEPTVFNYVDDISEFVEPEINGSPTKGHFCYYIIALEGPGNPHGVVGESKSNISCAHQETVTHLPNAFNPKSGIDENRTFKPVISFVNDYSLIIYSRWGDIVFQTNDPLNGWNGTGKDGALLKKGTYVFHLKYRTKNNKLVEKSGQINLVY